MHQDFSLASQFAAVFAAICEVRLDPKAFDPKIQIKIVDVGAGFCSFFNYPPLLFFN